MLPGNRSTLARPVVDLVMLGNYNSCNDCGYVESILFIMADVKHGLNFVVIYRGWQEKHCFFLVAATDKWVCCRCVSELEANDTDSMDNVSLVVVTDSDYKVDGNYEWPTYALHSEMI